MAKYELLYALMPYQIFYLNHDKTKAPKNMVKYMVYLKIVNAIKLRALNKKLFLIKNMVG